MARKVFNAGGAPSNDWSVVGNWDVGSIPATGDTAVLTGGTSIVAGLDQHLVNLAELIVPPEFTGVIGNSPSDPLKIGATRVVLNGGGIGAGSTVGWLDAGVTFDFDDVVVNRTGTGIQEFVIMGTIVRAQLTKGKLTFYSGTVSKLYADAPSGQGANAIWKNIASVITDAFQRSGTGSTEGGTITNLNVDLDTFVSNLAATITNLIQRGGTVTWGTTATLALLRALGGTFDATADYRAKTITEIDAHEGSTVKLNNLVGNIIATTVRKFGNAVILGPDGKVFDL